jgi:hypothetical protein
LLLVDLDERCGVRLAGRASDFNKVFGLYSFPLQMKSPLPFMLKKLRLEAADVPEGNSRNGPLSVSLYVLHPEKSVSISPAKVRRFPLDENRISFA